MQWNELKRIIGRWMRWHRFNRAVHWGLRGLALGLAASLIITLVLIPRHLLSGLEYIEWVFLSTQFGWILGFFGGFVWPVNERRLIYWFDIIFNLQERVSTAIEVQRIVVRHLQGRDVLISTWRDRQLFDTLEVARQVKPGKLLPFRWERSMLLLVYAMGFGVLVLWVAAQPQFQITEAERQATSFIKSEVDNLQLEVNNINQSSNLTQTQKDSLSKPLKDAINRMKAVTSPQQAMTILNQTEQQFKNKIAQPNASQLLVLKNIRQQLGKTNQSPFGAVSIALSHGDLVKAGQGLQDLDFSRFDTSQRQIAENELDQAGRNLSLSNPQIGKEFQAAAIALKQGNDQAAQQFLADAGKTMEQIGSQVVEAGIASQTASDLNQQQKAVALEVSNPATGQQRTAVALQITAAASTPVSSVATNGTGANPGGFGSNETIFSPVQPGSQYQPGTAVNGNTNESLVPYVNVLPSYSNAYHKALDNGEVPVYMQPVIRDYFSSLAP